MLCGSAEKSVPTFSKEELCGILKFGAENLFEEDDQVNNAENTGTGAVDLYNICPMYGRYAL